MSLEENKAVVRRYLEAAVAHFGEDLVGHEPGGDLHGQEGVRGSLAGFRSTFPDIRISIEDLVAEGDKVVARWSFTGTHEGEILGVAPTRRCVLVKGMFLG